MKASIRFSAAVIPVLSLLLAVPMKVSAAPTIVALGDSIGEGVQAADANEQTQPHVYLNLMAMKMGAQFTQPLIQSHAVGSVGTTLGRWRQSYLLGANNLSVSGSDLDDLFTDRADAVFPWDINSETDLVLYPRTGTQLEIAERWTPVPDYIICWAGNNEILQTITSWDQLDASQMTSAEEFAQDFSEIASRLAVTGSKLVFANIPDVTQIGFLMDNRDLEKFLGLKNALPPGTRTTLISMLMIRLGLADTSIFQDPDYILDPRELALIQQRVREYNYVIGLVAASVGAPVVDVYGLLRGTNSSPHAIARPAYTRFLGGWLSLDGVHPSNTGHARLANAFLETINRHYHTDYPLISDLGLYYTYLLDPHIDKDGDGRARGRPAAGILETLGPYLGISGDPDDSIPSASDAPAALRRWLLMFHYYQLTGFTAQRGLSELESVSQALEYAMGLAPRVSQPLFFR